MRALKVLIVLLIGFATCPEEVGGAARLYLTKKGTATQLIVDGRPFIMLAGELHNSSSSGLEYMERMWPKLKVRVYRHD